MGAAPNLNPDIVIAMDLTQLANLREFIGGVAVLVTLIYSTKVRVSGIGKVL